MGLDKTLLNMALNRTGHSKVAFMPPGGGGAPMDPSMGGGAPPMDPSMMGGGAPMDPSMMGGAPPMDPSMMGGAPPADPAAAGAAPPAAPPSGDIATAVQQAVQQAMSTQQGQTVGATGKAPKPDINMVATDVFQIKKLLYSLFQAQGWPLPDGLLDGPGRDPGTGAPAASPSGGSDASAGAASQSSISPIEPMQGAFPAQGGSGKSASERPGWNKVGSVFGSSTKVTSNARATARLFYSRRR